MSANCVLCDKPFPGCHCNFKAPRKGKWDRKTEIWSTKPRQLRDILQEIHDHFPEGIKGKKGYIFKFSLIELSSPAATESIHADELSAARKQ